MVVCGFCQWHLFLDFPSVSSSVWKELLFLCVYFVTCCFTELVGQSYASCMALLPWMYPVHRWWNFKHNSFFLFLEMTFFLHVLKRNASLYNVKVFMQTQYSVQSSVYLLCTIINMPTRKALVNVFLKYIFLDIFELLPSKQLFLFLTYTYNSNKWNVLDIHMYIWHIHSHYNWHSVNCFNCIVSFDLCMVLWSMYEGTAENSWTWN